MKINLNLFEAMTSAEALFEAWFAFRKGKMQRPDVQFYWRHLEQNIFRLHDALLDKKYHHSPYKSFYIHDPKERHIRKALVQDRIVHQAVYSVLELIYEPKFIHHAYSSRLGKGTHRAVKSLHAMTRKVSKNLTCPCWSLKCDIRKFYDSVDHEIFRKLSKKYDDHFKDEVAEESLEQSLQSYLGILSHADTHGLQETVKNRFGNSSAATGNFLYPPKSN